MDYSMPQKRKTKRDKKAKGRYKVYKKGGKYRSANVEVVNKGKEKKKKR